jgi:hypothetical protein
MLGVDDARFHAGDMFAFSQGLDEECPAPGWVDVFPLSEVEALRPVGDVLWERAGAASGDLDPLEFRSTWEPLAVTPAQRERFAAAVRAAAPAVVRVEGTRHTLWRGEAVVVDSVDLFVECGRLMPDALSEVGRVARECGVAAVARSSVTLGLARNPRVRTAVLLPDGSGA